MSDPQKAPLGAPQGSEQVQEGSLLDQIVSEGRLARGAETTDKGKNLVRDFVQQVLQGAMTVSKDAEAMITARIAEIDRLVSVQLNEVLHNAGFQKLEGTWRGLKYLLDQSETNDKLKIRVLNATKTELLRDLQRAPEFDQSALFKKVYEEEFGVFGGAGPEDIDLLERVSKVAASAHAPFLTAANPEMLNLDSFTTIDAPRDMAKIFDNTEYAKWKSFRASEDARYVGLALPHILMRLPYGKNGVTCDAFNYQEGVDGSDHSKYLWGNAAYALAARLTNAFAQYGWCAAIRGVEGGGLVEGLPTHNFTTDSGDIALKCPTESPITDRREKELADLGFIPLVHCKGTDYAAFFSVQSAQKAKMYDKDAANANARLSTQLPYILAISRFAHYMKSMMRDKIGGFMSRSQCEDFLNTWILQYVVGNDDVAAEVKARKPLRDARIEVVDMPGKPGAYRAVAFLKPHFQLDELTISLRLVADLPQGAK